MGGSDRTLTKIGRTKAQGPHLAQEPTDVVRLAIEDRNRAALMVAADGGRVGK
jgi:hypothetical protein